MSDLGNLSQCIVDSDSKELGRARRLRGRALVASTCLEATVVAGMLLWPLMAPAVLPSQLVLAPVPIFRSTPRQEIVRAPQASDQQRRPQNVLDRLLRQPPRIPPHVPAAEDNEPPLPYDTIAWVVPDGFGTNTGGIGREVTPIVRPEPNSNPRRPVVMSGGVMNARLIHRIEPVYPLAAKMMRLSGTVQLRAIIGTDGSVRNIEVVGGNPILAAAAVAAVEQWRYQPTRLSGKPVEVETVITVQFQMN